MEDNKNKIINITWDQMNFDPNHIGVILILEDGHFLYGKIHEDFQFSKTRIGHSRIFDECAKVLDIKFPVCKDVMDYAYHLASDDINIISLQIIPVKDSEEIVVGMNINCNNYQIDILNRIAEYFSHYHYGYTGIICVGSEKIFIYNESSSRKNDYSFNFEDFNNYLAQALRELKRNKNVK